MQHINHPEVRDLLEFFGCPSRNYPEGSVPAAEIHCQYEQCVGGIGVAGNGICYAGGDPRDEHCPEYRRVCPDCQGDGGRDGERAICQACAGTGWIEKREG